MGTMAAISLVSALLRGLKSPDDIGHDLRTPLGARADSFAFFLSSCVARKKKILLCFDWEKSVLLSHYNDKYNIL